MNAVHFGSGTVLHEVSVNFLHHFRVAMAHPAGDSEKVDLVGNATGSEKMAERIAVHRRQTCLYAYSGQFGHLF